MGNRANIVVRVNEAGRTNNLWLYSHHGGAEFTHRDAAKALADSEGRWNDPNYFGKQFIESLLGTGDLSGVGFWMDDNSHDVLVLDLAAQEAWFAPESSARAGDIDSTKTEVCDFRQFIRENT
jgi:hypothetical protein